MGLEIKLEKARSKEIIKETKKGMKTNFVLYLLDFWVTHLVMLSKPVTKCLLLACSVW